MKPTKKQVKWIALTALLLIILVMGLIVDPILSADNDFVKLKDGIHAYLTGHDNAENKAQIGSVDTKIVEEFEPPAKLEADVNFKKDVKIKNFGITPAFVRTRAVFTDSDIESLCVVDWNIYDATTNPTGWIYNKNDGYWYYPHVLESGDITPSLFTNVSIPNRDMNGDGVVDEETDAAIINTLMKDFDIIIYQEAYQALCNDGSKTTDENGYFVNYKDAWEKYQGNKPKEIHEGGYAIAYYANHTLATGSMSVSTHKIGESAKLASNAFEVDGYIFNGWNTKKDGSGITCDDEAVVDFDVKENAIINLYAQWEQKEISFIVSGTEYTAKNGMTWSDWFASSYNTTGKANGVVKDADGNEVAMDATIISGANYEIVVMATITITGNGASAAYIMIDGITYSSDAILEIPVGTAIACYAVCASDEDIPNTEIVLNDANVKSADAAGTIVYDYTAAGNSTISLTDVNGSGSIKITEE